jgi:phosphoheptose isomerase
MTEFRQFVDEYYRRSIETISSFDKGPLEDVLKIFLKLAETGGTLWVAGNGGSAAVADQIVCDTTKGATLDDRPAVRTVSLAANGSMLTALGNDIGYDQIFRQQLAYYLKPDDAVLLVSSSGNSPNVVEACKYAKQRGVPTIAFVGFDGGQLKQLADLAIHAEIRNYGIVEDLHMSLIHCLTQYMLASLKGDVRVPS